MAFFQQGVGVGQPNDPQAVRVVQQLLMMNREELGGMSVASGLEVSASGGLDAATLIGMERVMRRAGVVGPVRVRPKDSTYFQLVRETLMGPGSLPPDDFDPLMQLANSEMPFHMFRPLVEMRKPNQLIDILLEMTKGRTKSIANSKYGSAQVIADAIQLAMDLAQVDTPTRQAAFLAQTGVESDGFYTTREYASGKEYEGRSDLGNVRTGDGVRFAGRGFIQLTGRSNYTKCWQDLGQPLGDDAALPLKKDPLNPEWAEGLDGAARTTAWYWITHKLNAIADTIGGANEEAHFLKLSIAINGKNKTTGLPNGWEDRKKFYRIAKRLLGLKGGNV